MNFVELRLKIDEEEKDDFTLEIEKLRVCFGNPLDSTFSTFFSILPYFFLLFIREKGLVEEGIEAESSPLLAHFARVFQVLQATLQEMLDCTSSPSTSLDSTEKRKYL